MPIKVRDQNCQNGTKGKDVFNIKIERIVNCADLESPPYLLSTETSTSQYDTGFLSAINLPMNVFGFTRSTPEISQDQEKKCLKTWKPSI